MSQSATVVGLLALAFILYLAARGRLTAYTNVLWGSASKPSEGAGGSGGGSGGGLPSFGPIGDTVATIAKYAPELLLAAG